MSVYYKLHTGLLMTSLFFELLHSTLPINICLCLIKQCDIQSEVPVRFFASECVYLCVRKGHVKLYYAQNVC